MNRVILAIATASLVLFGLLAMKNSGAIAPYYVLYSDYVHDASPLVPLESVFIEPPNVDQIKKDLSGKTITIAGSNHQFAGPELNYMNILATEQIAGGGMVVEVRICADATIVSRHGVLRMRKSYTHENVCGSLKVYYDNKDGHWVYRMAENIDLQKMLIPNAIAPPSDTQVFFYPGR